MRFTKMHGAGNDYVYIDCFQQPAPEAPDELARQISHRHFGVGGDGLILIMPSQVADARMEMFNADGSRAEMCGNGIRCVAKYVHDHGICRNSQLRIETGAGILAMQLEIVGDVCQRVRVDMGETILDPEHIPTTLPGTPVVNRKLDVGGQSFSVTSVSMGNPHCIVFVPEVSDDLVLRIGPLIERHEAFPARVNVEFVQRIGAGELRQRTWERGSGETWACGTGASAVCVAGVLAEQSQRQVRIHLLGGDLELEWSATDNHVYMTGPATEVFSGQWSQTPAIV